MATLSVHDITNAIKAGVGYSHRWPQAEKLTTPMVKYFRDGTPDRLTDSGARVFNITAQDIASFPQLVNYHHVIFTDGEWWMEVE